MINKNRLHQLLDLMEDSESENDEILAEIFQNDYDKYEDKMSIIRKEENDEFEKENETTNKFAA